MFTCVETVDRPHVLLKNTNVNHYHLKSVLCDKDSTCFALGTSTSALVNALTQHGIPYEGLDRRSRCIALVHHLLYGHCHRRAFTMCQVVANVSVSMSSLAVSLSQEVFHFFGEFGYSSHFEELCSYLGFKNQTKSINSCDPTLLGFFERHIHSLQDPSHFHRVFDFLDEFEDMDKCSLIFFCGSHGLDGRGTLKDLRNRLFEHICAGQCEPSTRNVTKPPACESTTDEINPGGVSDFSTYFLAATVHKLRLKPLRRVATMYNLKWCPTDSLSKIRRTVKHYISTTQKGKRYLQSNARRHIQNPQAEFLNDARRKWPEVPSESLLTSLVDKFKLETSSTTLSSRTCASCAEKTLKSDSSIVPLSEIDLSLLRRPDFNEEHKDIEAGTESNEGSSDDTIERECPVDARWLHPAVTPPPFPYADGPLANILLEPKGVIETNNGPDALVLCKTCCYGLSAGRVPSIAVANRLFLGEVPEELKDLTAVEESMIGLCRARAIIVRLKEGLSGSYQEERSVNSKPQHQRALKGHVIVHPQRPDVVSELLPPSIEDIVAPICVVYTGHEAPSAEWL